jgi:hypothetical protein
MGYGAPDPSVWAQPSVICPGETTTVSWDAGPNHDEDCVDPTTTLSGPGGPEFCKTVEVTNDGGLPNEPPVGAIENEGSRTYTPSRTTTFTMNHVVRVPRLDAHGFGHRQRP